MKKRKIMIYLMILLSIIILSLSIYGGYKLFDNSQVKRNTKEKITYSYKNDTLIIKVFSTK